MKRFGSLCVIGFMLGWGWVVPVDAQQQIEVDVFPTITRGINGHLTLDRAKYVNLAARPAEVISHVDSARFDAYFHELDMSLGRQFHMISSETRWGNGFREDANRPGFIDTTYFVSKKNPNDNGMASIMNVLGPNCGVASHDAHDAYPSFMPKYTLPDAGDDVLPANNDAAAEMVAYYLRHHFTDFQRPATFEPINEPHWRYWKDPQFVEFHTKAKQKVAEMGVPVEIGGPCYSVGNFFKNEYGSLGQLTDFMSSTNFDLDFYSFHLYDYMRWDNEAWDFVGAVSSGLPQEGVFDALAAYHYNQTGKHFSYVASEHGGYISDQANRNQALDTLAELHFPGSGFLHEMKKRAIDNFIMVNSAIANTLTFMNHPHIVQKAVPFILLQSANWDPYYYSSLLVKEDFDKNSNTWHEAALINFYKYFENVKGRRILSHCNDSDIQHFAFVDDDVLILLFHNQSNVDGTISLNVADIQQNVENIMIRRTGKGADFLPFFSESSLASLDSEVAIGGQESIALFVDYQNAVDESELLNERIFYSAETGVQFTGAKTFSVSAQVGSPQYAILRVGISREASKSKEVEIRLNGIKLEVPVEDCADRITSDFYSTTKIVKVDPALLQPTNAVEVTFPDGGSGGVGAVVLRVGTTDPIAGIDQPSETKRRLFPNPARTAIQVEATPNEIIEIIDMQGRLWKKVRANEPNPTISIDGLPPGVYIVRSNQGEASEYERLIVVE